MTKHYLSDSDMPMPAIRDDAYYTARHMEAARAELIRDRFYFDDTNGQTGNKHGWLSRFSNPADYNKEEGSTREYREYEFASAIRSTAARLANLERL